jgi:hypothetical protein
MRYLFLLLTLATVLVASTASAQNNGDFAVQTPPDWTPSVTDDTPVIDVSVWFTENGQPLTEGVFIGPLQPDVIRSIDSSFFRYSGRTITANAYAEHTGQPDTRVQAVPVSNTFPLVPVIPPTLLAPATAP